MAQKQYSQELKQFQQSVAISREIGDRAGEAQTLANIGDLAQRQNQPEVAIAFYKQSVNLTEDIE